jgi:hypothetical protein
VPRGRSGLLFASQVPANMTWMLMAGSVLAIAALGYHLRASGSRHIVLTSFLLVMWAGSIVLIADLNRPRIGAIRGSCTAEMDH